MHRDRIVALYDVHSWAGVLFSLLIFVICASGALAVFSMELDRWANPALRVPLDQPQQVDADAALAILGRSIKLNFDRPVSLALPGAHPGLYSLPSPNAAERLHRTYLDAVSGAVTAPRQAYTYWFLRHLHVRLMNHWYGRVFIGAIGMAMLLSVVTGILIHQHPLRGLFRMRWRPGKGARALLADLHKWLGVWGMLFHLMIAFTGTWLGLEYAILKPPVALAKFDGDAAAARQALTRPTAPPAVQPADMVPLAMLIKQAEQHQAGFVPSLIRLENWGRSNAEAVLHGNLPYSLIAEGQMVFRFSGLDGRLIALRDSRQEGAWAQIAMAMKPLHYGYFGGLWLKLLYLLLGLAPAILALSGALIWFERRQRIKRATAAESGRAMARARRVVVALFAGGWLAILLGLVAPSLVALAGGHIGSDPMTPLFLLPWAGAALLLGLLRHEYQIAQYSMLAGTALALAAAGIAVVPPFDGPSLAVGVAALLLALVHAWLWHVFRRPQDTPAH